MSADNRAAAAQDDAAEYPDGQGEFLVGVVGVRGQPEPGNPVRGRRRAEAPYPQAVFGGRRHPGQRLARSGHGHGQDRAGGGVDTRGRGEDRGVAAGPSADYGVPSAGWLCGAGCV